MKQVPGAALPMRRKILLVDRDPALLRLLTLRLSLHYEVVATGLPERVMPLVHSQVPDVIVCDEGMRGVGGGDLSQALAQDALACAIPVILLTGEPCAEARGPAPGLPTARPMFAKSGRLASLRRLIELACAGADAAKDTAFLRRVAARTARGLQAETRTA